MKCEEVSMVSGNKKIAVVLSGCGVYDGAEIHESVLVMLRLSQLGVEYQCLAPDVDQMHVVNHLTGEPAGDTRNVLTESARIARGKIIALHKANPADYAGVIFPGGFGAAKNLCDFAIKGANMSVNADVATFVKAMHDAKKPVGLICIAPAMAPKLFGAGVKCTIGTDAGTADAVQAMGGSHVVCDVDGIVVDDTHNLVTTPAYMLANNIAEAAQGIGKLVEEVVRRA